MQDVKVSRYLLFYINSDLKVNEKIKKTMNEQYFINELAHTHFTKVFANSLVKKFPLIHYAGLHLPPVHPIPSRKGFHFVASLKEIG